MGAPPPLDKAFAALAALQSLLSPPEKVPGGRGVAPARFSHI